MKNPLKKSLAQLTLRLSLASLALGAIFPDGAFAQNGTWINPNGGSWATAANWQGGVIANGADSVADFSTLTLSANTTVTLDGAQTVGTAVFGDRGNAHNWFLNAGSGGTLTFSVSATTATLMVSNRIVTIDANLAGTAGLTQTGNGALILVTPVGYTGGSDNSSGTWEFLSSLDTTNNSTYSDELAVNGTVQVAATLNLDVDQNNSAGSINVTGTGTLQLVSTNSGPENPDLFFAPDAVANDYYGADLACATLDLGSNQRYIYALTEHNSVAQYDPYEDARIDAAIVGTGGITYIAQNTYTGGSPMECPLVLSGNNTFTGPVEIQRGSIYLFNADALVQTNQLLMDPAATNNARLFLYGNPAFVANLQSSNAGNALIANGNVNNPIAISPATLTIYDTSNTVFNGLIVDGQYEYDAGSLPPGSLSLVKDGPGTLTLTSTNTYSGSTAIIDGAMVLPAAQTGGGAISLTDGTMLGVTNIAGNTLAISDLSLGVSGNTTLNLTYSQVPVVFLAAVTTGTLEANGGANSITINVGTNGTGIPVGQYPLIQFTSGSIGGSGSGFSAFKLGSLPGGVVASLVNDATNNSIDLRVTTGTAIPSSNGQWINPNGGSWGVFGNWQGGNVASGVGYTADFSTLSLANNATVTLDGSWSIGNLLFCDRANAHGWTVNAGSGGVLTLRVPTGSPSINVSNQTATIGAQLQGNQGLIQNGNGTLVIAQAVAYGGPTTNNAGTIEFLANFSASNNSTYAAPLVINAGVAETAATLNLAVNQNNDAGSINVLGSGALRLTSTSNGTNSPDVYFGPDAVANDYYGADIYSGTLDLGASQRYFFAKTEHNSVAHYDPYEDARIDASIIGSGGITYIAQNTYGGSSPMECPLVLSGANTFTGGVEIQRGSIYLLNAQALVQTNALLLDPAVSNNARLFLYGNNAFVANLASSGNGAALIANGNVNNPITITPATLTVNQTTTTTFSGALVDGQYEYDDGALPPGSLSITKTGPGALTLLGANTYTGTTTVLGGQINVPAAQSGGGPFAVAGGTLGVAQINDDSLMMSDLSVSNGAMDFIYSGLPLNNLPAVSTASLEVNSGAASVIINIGTNGAGIPVGQYPLIQYTSGSLGGTGAGYAGFALGSLPGGVAATLVNNTANNSIDLKVTVGTALPAENGTWTNLHGGSWIVPANWQNGSVAQGIGYTADFSTLSLTADTTVTLDGALTIGNLAFGDQANAHNWFLNTGTGGPLTLRDNGATPDIMVANQTATIGVALAGTQGLTQDGNGNLVLVQPVGYTGGTTNNSGTLTLMGSLTGYKNTPLSIANAVQSASTLNLSVVQSSSGASVDITGGGLLRFIGTTNSSSNPDMYFGPDHNGTSYYGAFCEPTVMDLGASQRYIFSRSGHNSVSKYLGNEDCRISANIIGAGGITYIAQMNWSDMEVPLTLFGANTFTGQLEIQRGSIYLMNSSALVQSNNLLLDPVSTNNARLFLYGNNATVANLASSGAGNALIANGNPVNKFAPTPPATLTVVETGNTAFAGLIVDTQAEYDSGSFTSGNLSLVKLGPGTLTLGGTNTYTGSTTVGAGTLMVNPAQHGGGAFSVGAGAALGVNNINGNQLAISDLSLATNANSALDFAFGGPPGALAPIKTSTLEVNSGAGSVTVNVSAASSLPAGQFPLLQYSGGTIGGTGAGFSAFKLGSVPNSVLASLVNNTTNNSVDVVITPLTPKFAGAQYTHGQFNISLTGPQGRGFSVLATTNLAIPVSQWTVVGSGSFVTGTNSFTDTNAAGPARFYMIATP